ncbi:hypothetical protein VIBNIFTn2_120060 [Vibrio nigripulchritudo FTn2]|uniref:hypothetical protein n=1 Tax=Vibrio nigripulchritudo TaxID=28173 RepID=UPI0003B19E31|nr:hypothetical protein [Vibrio nigripulchritudo]CCN40078.1 hypothetical protein VIBNIFTn2_120060 [Vibrio nigripulchritudo FTn2]
MQINTQKKAESAGIHFQPKMAYVVHESPNHSPKNIVTAHEINQLGELQSGEVMRESHLDQLRACIPNAKIQILSENILVSVPNMLVFYVSQKPQLFRILDHSVSLGYRQFMLPMPPHIIYVKNQSGKFSIGGFAIKQTKRGQIDLTTKLYHSPTFNTYKANGNMCIGSVKIKQNLEVANIAHWVESFFSSVGSNLKHDVIVKEKSEDNIQQLLLGLNHKTHFPMNWLKETGSTFGQWLENQGE